MLLTAKAMAAELGLPLSTFYILKDLPHVLIGKRRYYLPESVKEWIRGRECRSNKTSAAAGKSNLPRGDAEFIVFVQSGQRAAKRSSTKLSSDRKSSGSISSGNLRLIR